MALNLLPKGTGRRRAIDKLAEVRRDLSIALSQMHAAGDEIALLRNDVADALRHELAALKVKFGPQLAAEANANRITVPPMVRPVDGPEDEATAPLNVKPLWDALGIRPDDDTQPIPAA